MTTMKSKEWSIKMAGALGAAFGVLYAYITDVMLADKYAVLPTTPAQWTSLFVGAAAGMMLFAVVAAVRNFFVRRYR